MTGKAIRKILCYFVVALLTIALFIPFGLAAGEVVPRSEETTTPEPIDTDQPSQTNEPASTPDPMAEPPIDGTRTISLELGYNLPDGTKVRTEFGQVTVGQLMTVAKEYTYSHISAGDVTSAIAPYVAIVKAKGVTLADILNAAGAGSLLGQIAQVSLDDKAPMSISDFTAEKSAYNELYKHIQQNEQGQLDPLSSIYAPGVESKVPTLLAIWSGYNTYALGADATVTATQPAVQEQNLRFLQGQDNPLDGASINDYYAIKKITLIFDDLPIIDSSEDQNISISVGTNYMPVLETFGGLNDSLTSAYLKAVVNWTNSDSAVASMDDDWKITAVKEGTATLRAVSGNIAVATINVNVMPVYTIIYDKNSGSVEVSNMPAEQKKNHGEDIAIAANTPTRNDNYSFVGWNTAADGSGTFYSSGVNFNLDGNTTLYAIWKAPSHTISYFANLPSGATGEVINLPEATSVADGASITPKVPTLSGYKFLYWSESPLNDVGTSYWNGDTISNITADMTLYAHWQKLQTYTVTFDANGGLMYVTSSTVGEKKYTRTFDEGTVITLRNYVCKKGSTYPNGWKVSGTGAVLAASASYTVTGNVTLTAQWATAVTTPKPTTSYTIKYNANAGKDTVTSMPNTQRKSKGARVTISTQKPVRTGYTFVNWNTKADGKGTNYTGGTSYSTDKNLTLYAQWREVVITPSPTPSPTPPPTPTPIPGAVLDDPVVVEPIPAQLEPVVFFDEATPTPQPQEGEQQTQAPNTPQPTPTFNPWTEKEPSEEEEQASDGDKATYAIVGVANGIFLIVGGCLAIVKFNMQL